MGDYGRDGIVIYGRLQELATMLDTEGIDVGREGESILEQVARLKGGNLVQSKEQY